MWIKENENNWGRLLWYIGENNLSTPPLFIDTKGNLYEIDSAKPYVPTQPPPSNAAPVIPMNAQNTGNIVDLANWKMEKDAGTPGSAKNIIKAWDAANKVATFKADQTGKGGVRWSIAAAKSVPDTVRSICYDLTVQSPDWTQIACLEMDVNHTKSDGRTYFLCVQASQYSKSYEYSLLNSKNHIGWLPSTIRVNPVIWAPNVDKHIRIFTHSDMNGNVFYDGIEEDGLYTMFPDTAHGISTKSMNWTKQELLPNFQLDGAKDSGTMTALVKNLTLFYW